MRTPHLMRNHVLLRCAAIGFVLTILQAWSSPYLVRLLPFPWQARFTRVSFGTKEGVNVWWSVFYRRALEGELLSVTSHTTREKAEDMAVTARGLALSSLTSGEVLDTLQIPSWFRFHSSPSNPLPSPPGTPILYGDGGVAVSHGWPLPALCGQHTLIVDSVGKPTEVDANLFRIRQLWLPLRPLPFGFFVNWMLYTTVTIGLEAVCQTSLRRRRRAKELCVWCAHSRAGLEPASPCPECGFDASGRARQQSPQ